MALMTLIKDIVFIIVGMLMYHVINTKLGRQEEKASNEQTTLEKSRKKEKNVEKKYVSDNLEENLSSIMEKCSESAEKAVFMNGYTFHIVNSRGKLDYIVFVKSGDSMAEDCVIEMLTACISNMRQMHNSKYDKANFIKNMLADSILLIYSRFPKLLYSLLTHCYNQDFQH